MVKSYTDSKGGKVTISDFDITEFKDETTLFLVGRHRSGIKGYDIQVVDGSPRSYVFGTTEGDTGMVYCAGRSAPGRVWPFQNMVRVPDYVQEAVARERIAAFAAKHPDIAKQLKEENIQLTALDAKPATLAELEQYPSNYKACPIDKPDKIVERIAKPKPANAK